MPSKLLEFLVQFMTGTLSIKVTQFEKTGSICKLHISLGNLKIEFIFETRSRSHFSWPVNFRCSKVEFALFLHNYTKAALESAIRKNRTKPRISKNSARSRIRSAILQSRDFESHSLTTQPRTHNHRQTLVTIKAATYAKKLPMPFSKKGTK